MMFSGLEHTGKVPFDTVLIHGLVRDSQGRKMSKSLGNGIDPLEVIDKYGADALRFTLVTGNAPGNDMRFYWERVEASRNFANKVWNASRFIMMHLGDNTITEPAYDELKEADKWILSKVNTLAKEVTENMEKYELGVAVQKINDFIWTEFCDWYIEIVKPRLFAKEEDPASANAAFWTLRTVLIDSLKLLHPYMPFITEEIFCTIQSEEESIMISSWPEYKEQWNNPAAEEMAENINKNAAENQKALLGYEQGMLVTLNIRYDTDGMLYISNYDEELGKAAINSENEVYTLIVSALEKAGLKQDDVILCALVYDSKNSLYKHVKKVKAAVDRVRTDYRSFYCTYIDTSK